LTGIFPSFKDSLSRISGVQEENIVFKVEYFCKTT